MQNGVFATPAHHRQCLVSPMTVEEKTEEPERVAMKNTEGNGGQLQEEKKKKFFLKKLKADLEVEVIMQ